MAANHKYRVNVDALAKVVKRDAEGVVKATKMFYRGHVVDYSDEPERALELLGHRAIVPVNNDDDEIDDTSEAPDAPGPAEAAIHDTTNGGAAGGLAKPGPVLNEAVEGS